MQTQFPHLLRILVGLKHHHFAAAVSNEFQHGLFAGNFQSLGIIEGFAVIGALAIVVFLWGLRSLNKMAS